MGYQPLPGNLVEMIHNMPCALLELRSFFGRARRNRSNPGRERERARVLLVWGVLCSLVHCWGCYMLVESSLLRGVGNFVLLFLPPPLVR